MPAKPKTTAPTVSVVVPWRSTPGREMVWSFLRPRWESLGYEVVEGACPDGEWRKGVAVADGVSRASHDLLVIADADVWCSGIPAAVQAVRNGAGWAMPHQRVCRMTAAATARTVATGVWPSGPSTQVDGGTEYNYAERPYAGHPGGGATVLTRAFYEQVPIDPRFYGWGQEDNAWALALRALLGKEWRGVEDMWHLWHEPAPRMSRDVGNAAGKALHRRYWAAHRSHRTMYALIAEARGVLQWAA